MIHVEPTAEVTIPFDITYEEPKTHKDAIAIAINTADLIKELGGDIHYDNNDLHKAASLINGEDKPTRPRHISVSAEAAAAQALIKEFDFQAFADVMQARSFITNKLIKIADCGDPKVELKALELLGKHSDIGLFTERSEITVHHTTSQALENSIKERVKRLLGTDITDITPSLIDELDDLKPKKSQEIVEIDEKQLESHE
jgi:hypothetical protein